MCYPIGKHLKKKAPVTGCINEPEVPLQYLLCPIHHSGTVGWVILQRQPWY